MNIAKPAASDSIIPQFFYKFKEANQRQVVAFWATLLVLQGIFSHSHIPHRLVNNTPVNDIS